MEKDKPGKTGNPLKEDLEKQEAERIKRLEEAKNELHLRHEEMKKNKQGPDEQESDGSANAFEDK
jgi:hypothetical protein